MPISINITRSLLPLLRPEVETLTSMLRLKVPAILFFGSSEVYFYTVSFFFFFLRKLFSSDSKTREQAIIGLVHTFQTRTWRALILFCLLPLLFCSFLHLSLSHLPLPPWWQILFKSLRQGTSIETGRGNVAILSCPVNSSGMKSHSIALAVLLRQALLAIYFNIVAWKFPYASR